MSERKSSGSARRITAEEAASLVQSGMWLDYGACLGQPDEFDAALARRRDELRGVKIRACLSTRPRAVLECDPEGRHFHWINLHYSAYDRRKSDEGLVSYMPVNLGEIPDYYRRFIDPVDIAIIKARPMDENGNFNLSGTNLWHLAVIERARVVIIEESPGLPHVMGEMNNVPLSAVDYVITGNDLSPPELPAAAPNAVDRAVARLITAEIEDGACLQIGIGGMPNAVCSLLAAEGGARDLGVHTEMLTDGLIDLYRTGQVTGARKTLHPGRMVFSFALGTAKLYEAIDHNPDIIACPVDETNLPHMISRNDKAVAINNTTQIDLQGQAASESDGFRHISGTGGQLQFVRGAYASRGGKSFICLASTYEKNGARRSRIVPALTRGNIVTTPRTDMMYVVTEYGIVNLKGKSTAERAMALIGIAHPDFREELERDAYENRLIPRGFFDR